MIKSHNIKGFYRSAFAASIGLALIFNLFTAPVYAATPSPIPLFTTAAFSQLNSGSSPSRVITTDLNIFSLDASAKKITVWRKTFSGSQLRQFSGIADIADGAGSKGVTFSSPFGLAKHPTQNIIAVTDKGVGAQRVSFYSYTETASAVLFTYLGAYQGVDLINPDVVNPSDVAFFPNGDVAVCGNKSNGLNAYVIRLTGSYSSLTASPTYLYYAPVGTADGLDIDQATGNIFIASASDHCIYEHDGIEVTRIYGVKGSSGTANGYLHSPTDVSVWRGASFAPKVVVADQFNNRVTIFNLSPNNQVYMTVGGYGTGEGQFSRPYSVFAADEVTVADTVNRRVQLFSFDMSNLDTDNDGIPDVWEMEHGLDPLDPLDAALDPDNDGLSNLREYGLGTDIYNFDTDNDGFSDGYEFFVLHSDPLDPNSPGTSSITIMGNESYPESSSATRNLTVFLGTIPASPVVLNVTGYLPGAVAGPATLTIPAGTNSAVLAFQTLNGPTNCTLAFAPSAPAAYSPTNFTFSVLNVAPTITSATADADTVSSGGSLVLSGVATDPSSDALTYTWTFDDGSPARYGAMVTNAFTTLGTVQVTLTVTDPDGGSDAQSFDVMVESGSVPTIAFTAIDPESLTFRIPTVAKNNSFLIKIAPVLSANHLDWNNWLLISSANLVVGGSFSETMLMAPSNSVGVVSADQVDDYTYVTVDITSPYANYDTLFFKVLWVND